MEKHKCQIGKRLYTVVTPGLLQKMSKKCNSPGIFSVLIVFLGVFFRKFAKNRKKSQNVTVRESLLYRATVTPNLFLNIIFKTNFIFYSKFRQKSKPQSKNSSFGQNFDF